jgi:transcription antitermination factor NusG
MVYGHHICPMLNHITYVYGVIQGTKPQNNPHGDEEVKKIIQTAILEVPQEELLWANFTLLKWCIETHCV